MDLKRQKCIIAETPIPVRVALDHRVNKERQSVKPHKRMSSTLFIRIFLESYS